MNRREFELLRDLPDKRITDDIRFTASKATDPNLTFSGVALENAAEWIVRVNGTYKPDIPSLTINFTIPDVGPICRIDINGPVHKPVGRTHKHSLRHDDDPRKNLPNADVALDFEGLSPLAAHCFVRGLASPTLEPSSILRGHHDDLQRSHKLHQRVLAR